MIAAIVLAAGGSTRMGRPKMLLPLEGRTVLAAAALPLLAAGLERVVVVLGAEADRVRRGAGLPEDPRLLLVENTAWREGMSSSIRYGLAACGDAAAALIVLGDQPGASRGLIRRIVEAGAAGAPLVVPTRDGRAGHPVLFGRALWDELRAVSGDRGGRDVVRRHWPEALQVPGEALPDLDTDQDYRALTLGVPIRDDQGWELP